MKTHLHLNRQKNYHVIINENKARVALLVPYSTDFKARDVIRDRKKITY